MTEKIAVYPGTFDPITLGHLDIIRRATKLCDTLIIAIAHHHGKTPFFSAKKRIEMIKQTIAQDKILTCHSIKIVSFEGLLVDFITQENANFIIRGLRTVSDFDYEFQMVGVNRQLAPNIETIFLPADMTTQFISSSLVRQIYDYGGDLLAFVPATVIDIMKDNHV